LDLVAQLFSMLRIMRNVHALFHAAYGVGVCHFDVAPMLTLVGAQLPGRVMCGRFYHAWCGMSVVTLRTEGRGGTGRSHEGEACEQRR
jgi:hypothetical protein